MCECGYWSEWLNGAGDGERLRCTGFFSLGIFNFSQQQGLSLLSFFYPWLILLLVASVTWAVMKVTCGGLVLHLHESVFSLTTAKSELIIWASPPHPGPPEGKIENSSHTERCALCQKKFTRKSRPKNSNIQWPLKFFVEGVPPSIEESLTFVQWLHLRARPGGWSASSRRHCLSLIGNGEPDEIPLLRWNAGVGFVDSKLTVSISGCRNQFTLENRPSTRSETLSLHWHLMHILLMSASNELSAKPLGRPCILSYH